jgi:hypothetical protein
MKHFYKLLIILVVVLLGLCTYFHIKGKNADYGHKVVICVPVYGQSYALGEEAIRITDFDSLRINYNGRIVTEHLDYAFGYFDPTSRLKQYIKRLLHYDKRSFELSIYGMAESLATKTGEDTIICTFPGGLGTQPLKKLMKGSSPYQKFLEEITCAYSHAQDIEWDFNIPAICWMQGESDIADYPGTDYKTLLEQIYLDLNTDIKKITHQSNDIRIISYQSNIVTKGTRYKPNNYNGTEAQAPQAQMELIRDDSAFWASGPMYPYSYVDESLHPDGVSQKRIGYLVAESLLALLHHEKRFIGVVPVKTEIKDNELRIQFNVPCHPLCFDTVSIRKVNNYGFNVIRKDNIDIISNVNIDGDTVIIRCNESPIGCKIRYAVNGEYWKSGWNKGPRGNLRDSQGANKHVVILGKKYALHNWCFQVDYLMSNKD